MIRVIITYTRGTSHRQPKTELLGRSFSVLKSLQYSSDSRLVTLSFAQELKHYARKGRLRVGDAANLRWNYSRLWPFVFFVRVRRTVSHSPGRRNLSSPTLLSSPIYLSKLSISCFSVVHASFNFIVRISHESNNPGQQYIGCLRALFTTVKKHAHYTLYSTAQWAGFPPRFRRCHLCHARVSAPVQLALHEGRIAQGGVVVEHLETDGGDDTSTIIYKLQSMPATTEQMHTKTTGLYTRAQIVEVYGHHCPSDTGKHRNLLVG